MKNSIIAFISSALLFGLFSCKNGFDVQQRRYTKGFYVSHSGKKNLTEEQKKSDQKIVVTKENATAVVNPEVEKTADEQNVVSVREVPENNSETVVSQKNSEPEKRVGEKKSAAKNESVVVSDEKKSGEEKLKAADAPVGGAALDETGTFILLLVLSLLVPPLAVYLKQKSITKWFWITLLLCLFTGFVVFIGIFGSLWFLAFIFALLVVLDILN